MKNIEGIKKIFSILILTLFLFSCSNTVIKTEIVKKDFFIEIKTIDDFSDELVLEKNARVGSSQEIKLTSQVAGRISNIYTKEGNNVKKGDILMRIEDNIANYSLVLEKTQNALDKAKINYETTENKLTKSISDLKINLGNLKIDEYNSSSSLQLNKIENSIEKMKIDYENLKISNQKNIDGFKNSLNKDLISFKTYIYNIIDFSDKLLGVTSDNSDSNNAFEMYLGAKDSSQKNETEIILKDLIIYNNKLNFVVYDFVGDDDFDKNISIINDGYVLIDNLLVNLNTVLDNSIPSIGSLSKSDIFGYKASINSFRITYNTYNSGFIGLKNSINSFLKTYKNIEISMLKQIGLLNDDKKIYINSLDTKLVINESTLDEATSNKSLTLRQLDLVLNDARIAYKQALNNYNKLIIKSPIDGVIGNILVDEGQEINPGTQLFNIYNNLGNEVSVSFTKEEIELVNIGNNINIILNGNVFTGSIYSISTIADNNLKYIGRAKFDDDIKFLGNIVKVIIPFNLDKKLIPINILEITNSGYGIINLLINGKILEKKIKLGKFYGDMVEILDYIDKDTKIIITDVKNFEDSKFLLKIK